MVEEDKGEEGEVGFRLSTLFRREGVGAGQEWLRDAGIAPVRTLELLRFVPLSSCSSKQIRLTLLSTPVDAASQEFTTAMKVGREVAGLLLFLSLIFPVAHPSSLFSCASVTAPSPSPLALPFPLRHLVDMNSTSSPACWVCRKDTESKCSSCLKQGLNIRFCSPKHQCLVRPLLSSLLLI
jgi:hypothetical protein